MSKREKRLEKWKNNPPKEAPIDEVVGIIRYFFPQQFDEKRTGSHRFRIKHKLLIEHPDYGPDGGFDIPVKGGQKVKGVYLKLLAQAVEVVAEFNNKEQD